MSNDLLRIDKPPKQPAKRPAGETTVRVQEA
jgi:hypothetical protein